MQELKQKLVLLQRLQVKEQVGVKITQNIHTNQKGRAGRPTKSKGPDIEKDNPDPKQPKHDTDRDVNIKPSHWRPKGKGYMRDQLTKRGFRGTRMPDGSKIYKAYYLREVLKRITAGTWV